jgi:hypothetical protein
VDDNYLSGFERHVVGSAAHEEYWIPAHQLPNFNRQIQGKIEVEAAFFGKSFIGFVPDKCNFEGKNAEEQFVVLAQSWGYSRMDFGLEISVNRKAVFLNCLYWIDHDFSAFNVTPALKHDVLDGVAKVWEFSRIEPELPPSIHQRCASLLRPGEADPRGFLELSRPPSRAVQQREYFNLAAADSISNEERSRDDDEFASSGDPAGAAGLGKPLQQFHGGEDTIEHDVGSADGGLASPVIVNGAQVPRGFAGPDDSHFRQRQRVAIAFTLRWSITRPASASAIPARICSRCHC